MAVKEADKFAAEREEFARHINSHEERKAAKAKHLEKMQPVLLKCLDPTLALQYENRKPLYEWKIECHVFLPTRKGRPAGTRKYDEQVVAQTENDAWALFCDKVGLMRGRKACQKLTITRLNKRSIDDE